jgi:hypothetical protein
MADIKETYLKDLAHKADLIKSPSGDLDEVDGLNNLQQALYHRLITQPGSLVHRPDYGVGIKNFANALNSLDNQRRLAAVIDEQFGSDFRVESVTGIKITVDDDKPETVKIFVRVKAIGYDEVELLFKPFREND